MEVGEFTISCRFKNCEYHFVWIFTRMYGPTLGSKKEDFWGELGAIKGLWADPWCVGGDFSIVRFSWEHNGGNKMTSTMRRFLEVVKELEL